MTGFEYALEADPGQLTASFPLMTLDEAVWAVASLQRRRPDLPVTRVVCRPAGSAPGTPFQLYRHVQEAAA